MEQSRQDLGMLSEEEKVSTSDGNCFPEDLPSTLSSSAIPIVEYENATKAQQTVFAWENGYIQAAIDFLAVHGYAIAKLKLYGQDECGFFLVDTNEYEFRDPLDWPEHCKRSKYVAERNMEFFLAFEMESYFAPVAITENVYRVSKRLPVSFPTSLVCRGISLEDAGLNDIAWTYEDVLLAVEIFYEADYAILGGDVYHVEQDRIDSTYDSWSVNWEGRSRGEYLAVGREMAVSYIKRYFARNGDKYCYALIYTAA